MELFPTNIATGEAFCNRVEERKLLSRYISQGMHTVIIAPRRYGKTSLINQVLIESKLPYCLMELTMTTSGVEVERLISRKVGELLQSILPKANKAKSVILNLFKLFNPEIVLSMAGQKIIFHLKEEKDTSASNITDLFSKLDEAATQLKKKIVVVMDEFQELSNIEGHKIEAGIRHAMQYSKSTSYIFSGSNRHMLQSMFSDKNRPFYNSCEIMWLERITKVDYESFIQKAAKTKWKKEIKKGVLERIFEITERHSSYMNRVCGYFWLTGDYPTIESVNEYWSYIVESRRSEFSKDMLALSKNQRRLLRHLAKNPENQPGNQAVCHATELPEASLRQALQKLFLLDYLYKDEGGYIRVLDPAMKDFINKIADF